MAANDGLLSASSPLGSVVAQWREVFPLLGRCVFLGTIYHRFGMKKGLFVCLDLNTETDDYGMTRTNLEIGIYTV